MKIGIIGAGAIGLSVARNLASAGHEVKVADARGTAEIGASVSEAQAVPVELEDVIQDVDAIVVSVPTSALPELASLLGQAGQEVVIIDTSNYYPFRDGAIADLDNGKPESVWVSEQVGRPIVKAFNAALAHTQATKGVPRGSAGRIAMPVAGDDDRAKAVAIELIDSAGFDPVDAGSLADSWRQQPGTPAYCTELGSEELRKALTLANKDKSAELREVLIQQFFAGGDSLTHEDVVTKNRTVTARQ